MKTLILSTILAFVPGLAFACNPPVQVITQQIVATPVVTTFVQPVRTVQFVQVPTIQQVQVVQGVQTIVATPVVAVQVQHVHQRSGLFGGNGLFNRGGIFRR